MPLTRNQKIGIGVAVAGAVALIGFSANASDTPSGPPTGECPEGFIRQPDPNHPGQFICVRGPDIEPPDNDLPDVDDIDDPLPPPPPQCNYSGCGPQFNNGHAAPAYYALRIQQLGYPINVPPIAANGSTIAVNPARAIIREFQRDYNAARTAQTVQPTPPKLGEDGLVGNATIAAIENAHKWVQTLNLPWVDIVELA